MSPAVLQSDRTKSHGDGRSMLRFRPEIEGLRAVAVLLVFANHLFGGPRGGFVGVDVFFVISGFLITGLLEREYQQTRRISIKGFYARRARRILPGALLVLLSSAVCAHILFYASRAHDALIDIVWAGGFVANVHFSATGTDYFHADRPPSPVQHFWSLSVEEQFYLVWPLLLFGLSAIAALVAIRFAHTLKFMVAFLVAGTFVLALGLTRQDSTTAYFDTTARAWELGIGALLAVLTARSGSIARAIRLPAFIGGLALIAWSAAFTTESGNFPAPAALPAVAGAALIIVAGTGPDLGRLSWPLTNPATRYVGRVSYSLYLWHWPVIVFLPVFVARHDVYFDITSISIAAAITVASYHFVEDPLRRLDYGAAFRTLRAMVRGAADPLWQLRASGGLRDKRYAGLAAVSLLSVGLIALALQPYATPRMFAGSFTTGPEADAPVIPARPNQVVPPAVITTAVEAALNATTFPKLDPSVNEVANAHGPEWKTCGQVRAATLAKCTFPAVGQGPSKKLVLMGDSFGIAWIPTMRAAQSHGYTVYALTHAQCPAVDASFKESVGDSAAFTKECNAARDWYVTEVARLKPDIVVIGNYDAMLNEFADHAKGQAAVDEWAAGTKKIIDRIREAGAKRIVWMASPPQTVDLRSCDQGASSSPADCVDRAGDTWSMVTAAETRVAEGEGITLLDTSLFFCSANGYCPAFVGNTPTHTEGHHLTGEYAAYIGPYVIPYVLGEKVAA